MRSASSAGETVTKNTQDPHVSIPKRAETFNGASSSKESQISTLNINANILHSYLHKSSTMNDANSSEGSVRISKTSSNASDTAAGGARSNANSDLSTDFGYHSRLCVDLNHDLDDDNCSCALFDNNNSVNNTSRSKVRHNSESELKKKKLIFFFFY